MLAIMEGLESYPIDSDKWRSHLRRLYLFSMGEFKTERVEKETKEPEVEDNNNKIVVGEEKKDGRDEESKESVQEEAKDPPQGKFRSRF